MDRRKELKLAYKENPRPMGVYQIKNQSNGKIFIAGSMNLPGSFNSNRFQLNFNCHHNKALQDDWNEYGASAFTFDVLETLKSEEIAKEDWREAVSELEAKWLNTLQPYGEGGYHKQKL
ncbi:MAG: GIY-YIG nuclease family protein [Bacillota bacterium]